MAVFTKYPFVVASNVNPVTIAKSHGLLKFMYPAAINVVIKTVVGVMTRADNVHLPILK